jgi:hypothetical protein
MQLPRAPLFPTAERVATTNRSPIILEVLCRLKKYSLGRSAKIQLGEGADAHSSMKSRDYLPRDST